MTDLLEVFDARYLGNTASQWLIASAIFLVVFFGLLLLRRVFRSHSARLAATPQAELVELPLMIASRTTVLFVLVAAVFAATQSLELPTKIERLVFTVFTIAAFWQAGVWATTAVLAALERKRRGARASDRAAGGTRGHKGLISPATSLWVVVLL